MAESFKQRPGGAEIRCRKVNASLRLWLSTSRLEPEHPGPATNDQPLQPPPRPGRVDRQVQQPRKRGRVELELRGSSETEFLGSGHYGLGLGPTGQWEPCSFTHLMRRHWAVRLFA